TCTPLTRSISSLPSYRPVMTCGTARRFKLLASACRKVDSEPLRRVPIPRVPVLSTRIPIVAASEFCLLKIQLFAPTFGAIQATSMYVHVPLSSEASVTVSLALAAPNRTACFPLGWRVPSIKTAPLSPPGVDKTRPLSAPVQDVIVSPSFPAMSAGFQYSESPEIEAGSNTTPSPSPLLASLETAVIDHAGDDRRGTVGHQFGRGDPRIGPRQVLPISLVDG